NAASWAHGVSHHWRIHIAPLVPLLNGTRSRASRSNSAKGRITSTPIATPRPARRSRTPPAAAAAHSPGGSRRLPGEPSDGVYAEIGDGLHGAERERCAAHRRR